MASEQEHHDFSDEQLEAFAKDLYGCLDIERLAKGCTDEMAARGLDGIVMSIVRVNIDKLTEGTGRTLSEPYAPISFSEGDRLRIDIPYLMILGKKLNGEFESLLLACDDDPIIAADNDKWIVAPVGSLPRTTVESSDDDLLGDATKQIPDDVRDMFSRAGIDIEHITAMLYVPEARLFTYEDLTITLAQVRMNAWDKQFLDQLLEKMEPTMEGIKPSTHVVANSKPTQVLRAGKSEFLFRDGGFPLSVGKKSGQLMINFGLAFEDPVTELSEKIDAEDVAVIEAVTTLRAAGNTVISPFQIAESMGYVGPSQELQDEVHERVMRLRGIVGRIDWTEQAKAWKVINPETGRPFETAEISGNLLSAVVFEGTDDQGNRYIRYQLSGEPITFTHARLVGQVINYDQSLLDLRPIDEDGRRAKRVTRDQKKILRAILAYVAVLKNPRNKMGNVIGYETLWSHEGYVPSSESARKRSIKTTHGFLRALQEVGEIYGFEAISERSARHKQIQVRVIVEKPTKRKR